MTTTLINFVNARRRRLCQTAVAFVILLMLATGQTRAESPRLFTPGNTFTSNSHYVSTIVFLWFTSDGGQRIGPWRPIEGRENWRGDVPFWESQVKQMMAANIDMLHVALMPGDQPLRLNLFRALYNLRSQGYNVPKVAPFLDTNITAARGWTRTPQGERQHIVDLSTARGKDVFVDQYVGFYKDYYDANTDARADDFIAQLDGRVVLNAWHFFREANEPPCVTHLESLTRADVQRRLAEKLGEHALFQTLGDTSRVGIYMINSEMGNAVNFADERLAQFECTEYYHRSLGKKSFFAAQIKAGYWDQNARNPGDILKREGGAPYRRAWTSVQKDRAVGLKHVNIESWNEYDEGSGIYAADSGPPYIKPGSGNVNTDTWSAVDDPYEYIKTTAAGARAFNDAPDCDATILFSGIPNAMQPGEKRMVSVVVRNDGDLSWTGAAGFKFGQNKAKSAAVFMEPERASIDDETNEIPTYGGIFRGRPIAFNIELSAPKTPGIYKTVWLMSREPSGWFGQELALTISVAASETPKNN